MSERSGISRDEWLKALGEDMPNDPAALTTYEIATLLGLERTAAKDRVRRLLQEGKAMRACKWIVNGAGVRTRVPAYKLIVPTKKK
jgi:hypothetical protein